MSCFLGIDPGVSGGLALIEDRELVMADKMPTSEVELCKWMETVQICYKPQAVIEVVHAMPRQGVKSMFTFGRAYGAVRLATLCKGIPLDECRPREWQKALGISPKKPNETKTQWKKRLQAKAHQLFPRAAEKITLQIADAVLIADFLRRCR